MNQGVLSDECACTQAAASAPPNMPDSPPHFVAGVQVFAEVGACHKLLVIDAEVAVAGHLRFGEHKLETRGKVSGVASSAFLGAELHVPPPRPRPPARALTLPCMMGWPCASSSGSMSSTTYSMWPPCVQMLLKGVRQNTGAVISQCCSVIGSSRWMVVPTRVQMVSGLRGRAWRTGERLTKGDNDAPAGREPRKRRKGHWHTGPRHTGTRHLRNAAKVVCKRLWHAHDVLLAHGHNFHRKGKLKRSEEGKTGLRG